jgi:hypothetical protein
MAIYILSSVQLIVANIFLLWLKKISQPVSQPASQPASQASRFS